MRMWMIDPKFMCRKHLLGEHVEIHMIVGHMKKLRKVTGFLQKNCLEPESIIKRHSQLALEMARRGYNHTSELEVPENLLDYLTPEERLVKIDRQSAREDLIGRCGECRYRFDSEIFIEYVENSK